MKYKIIFCAFSVLSTVRCRKYDIESEAVKLYGEDLNSVLLRFRKSPDYLRILEDKVKEIRVQISELLVQIQDHYRKQIVHKVTEVVGGDAERTLRSKLDTLKPKTHLREDEKRSPVAILDEYPKLHQGLTTGDINYFKDLGFEYAGQAIHTVIKHMGPDDTPGRSTKLPFGGGHDHNMKSTASTTEHAHIHSVKTSTDSDITVSRIAESEQTVASFRYTYKHRAAS